MRIIVAGCGKVGANIVRHLSAEGHDVSVIDINSKVVQEISDTYDVMGVVGNAASYSVLEEADIEDTNLLIAVTNSDELNLLCCLFARKAGRCQTIARVRNPIYREETQYIKEELGLSMTINPEYAAAQEAGRLLRFPSAIKVEIFGGGRVELLEFVVPEGSALDNCSLMEISHKIKSRVLVVAVERGEEVIIPNGQFVLHSGDRISIVAEPMHARGFFHKIGVDTKRVGNTIIAGGGTIAYYLANILTQYGIDVKIIEKDPARCDYLAENLPHAIIINADATDPDILSEEGVDTCDSFVTMTGIDEENVFLSLFVKQHNPRAKLITKTNRYSMDEIIENMDVGSLIHPKNITAEYILRYVRAMQNSLGSNVETMYQIVDNKAEALEFAIQPDAPVLDTPLSQLHTRDNTLIAGIIRNGKMIFADGQTTIKVGDRVIVVTKYHGFQDIRDILEPGTLNDEQLRRRNETGADQQQAADASAPRNQE